MRLQHYRRIDTLSTHNFDACQIYVGRLDNPRGEVFKGVSILWAGGNRWIDDHLPLSREAALEFADYLDSVCQGNIPSKFKLKGCGRSHLGNELLSLRLNFSKPKDGYLKCRITFVFHTIWGAIRPELLSACAASLRKLYDES